MIVLDTSALIEVLAQQPSAEACAEVLSRGVFVMSAATLTEALIVARRKRVSQELDELLAALELTIVEVDVEFAELAANAYGRWGKGFHAAGLNYGDCFSYALAELYGCPLLYVGDDFARTDVRSALG
ncbi:type II toxin-antitoxin system VapC family toxin [Brevundimonas sp.]|uniref:type II toxin-antitoxin system VapC family toxin n=1 Tax=Brevundimonas sp. TaxID=1871086 RepID=UPI002E15ED1F|nr:type II toxin-antitoxin system VapC family toxin [Brevundimonas sp.]